jgi:pyruvate,water dikinase
VVGGGWLYVERTARRQFLSITPAALRRTFDDEIAPDCEVVLARAEADGTLEAALVAYVHVYRRYVDEVGPTLRAARRALDDALRTAVGEPLAAHGALLAGTAGLTAERDALLYAIGTAGDDDARARLLDDYRARFGAYAPAWDVAVPTDDEAPARVAEMAAAWAARGRSPSELHDAAVAEARAAADRLCARADDGALRRAIEEARAALTVAEDDDRLFFRAQRAVRRALAAVGDRLVRDGRLAHAADVFWLALDDARRPPEGVDLAARVRGNRRAWEAAARIVPPRTLVDGRPVAEAPPPSRAVLRGHPTAGRARGRAVVIADPASAPTKLPNDAIVVAPALMPSLAYLLPQARALVTAHGGATSHGATLAREYGVPAVLGVGRAHGITDGASLLVDATAGRVYILSSD